jgi:hypothetical protein
LERPEQRSATGELGAFTHFGALDIEVRELREQRRFGFVDTTVTASLNYRNRVRNTLDLDGIGREPTFETGNKTTGMDRTVEH